MSCTTAQGCYLATMLFTALTQHLTFHHGEWREERPLDPVQDRLPWEVALRESRDLRRDQRGRGGHRSPRRRLLLLRTRRPSKGAAPSATPAPVLPRLEPLCLGDPHLGGQRRVHPRDEVEKPAVEGASEAAVGLPPDLPKPPWTTFPDASVLGRNQQGHATVRQ